jgi:excisionase family DNA binding protein
MDRLQMGGTLNNEQAAAYLGCTPGTLRVWTCRRLVPFVKVGRLTRFRRCDLDAWLDARVVVARADNPPKSSCIGRMRQAEEGVDDV